MKIGHPVLGFNHTKLSQKGLNELKKNLELEHYFDQLCPHVITR